MGNIHVFLVTLALLCGIYAVTMDYYVARVELNFRTRVYYLNNNGLRVLRTGAMFILCGIVSDGIQRTALARVIHPNCTVWDCQ